LTASCYQTVKLRVVIRLKADWRDNANVIYIWQTWNYNINILGWYLWSTRG